MGVYIVKKDTIANENLSDITQTAMFTDEAMF